MVALNFRFQMMMWQRSCLYLYWGISQYGDILVHTPLFQNVLNIVNKQLTVPKRFWNNGEIGAYQGDHKWGFIPTLLWGYSVMWGGSFGGFLWKNLENTHIWAFSTGTLWAHSGHTGAYSTMITWRLNTHFQWGH